MFVATWVGLCLLALTAVIVRPTNHDVAWYLHMVGVMLDGGTAYVDAVDTNPPLILLLTIPPVAVARFAGITAAAAFYAYVFLLAVISAIACAWLASRTWPAQRGALGGLVSMALFFLLLAFPKGDFGQREHLALLMTVPYVLTAALRALGRPVSTIEGVASGVIGGLGFALKPHFVLAWIAVEGAVAWQGRGIRVLRQSSPVAVVITFLVYGVVAWIFFPEYSDVAYRVWEVYGALDSPAVRLVNLREIQAGAVALAIVALLRLPIDYASPLRIVWAASAGFLGASVLQFKGWSYQMLPAQAYLALFFLIAFLSLAGVLPSVVEYFRGGLRGIVVSVALVFLASAVKYAYEGRQAAANDMVAPLAALIRQHAPAGPIALLSMRSLVYPAFPLVNETGARWSLRHHSLWFLRAFYARELNSPNGGAMPLHAPASMSTLERAFFEEIVGDLCRTPPRLLAIDTPADDAPAGRRALDLNAYYGQDARFAHLMSGYRQVGVVASFIVWHAERPSCKAPPSM